MTPPYLRRRLRAALMAGGVGVGVIAAAVIVGVVLSGISVVARDGYNSDFVAVAGDVIAVGFAAAVVVGAVIVGAVIVISVGAIVELVANGDLARARTLVSRAMTQGRAKARLSQGPAKGACRCRVRYGWRIWVLATLMAPTARQRWLEAIAEALYDFEPAHRPALLRDFQHRAAVVIIRSWTVDFVRSGASR